MLKKSDLLDCVDWPAVMAAPRYAGGHKEVMDVLFADATVISYWLEDDWQGTLAYAYEFSDGSVAVVTDYFGSCSGCDAWEGANGQDARRLVTSMVSSARLFPDRETAAAWAATVDSEAEEYPFLAARNLVFA